MDKFDSRRLDDLLRMFANTKSGRIPSSILLDEEHAPEDWLSAIGFLTEEGYLKESGNCHEITYRGKSLLHDGGFVSKDRRERILFYCTVVAAVFGLLSFLVSLAALVSQIHG